MNHASRLPEEIIQHVLSYCGTRGAVRSSVVCKAWYDAYSTRPVLEFDSGDGFRFYGSFVRFVSSTLQMYQHRKLLIHEVRFVLRSVFEEFRPHIDGWIEKVIGCSVRKLHLKVPAIGCSVRKLHLKAPPYYHYRCNYEIPQWVFEAESLEQIELLDCGLPPLAARGNPIPPFKNLKKLRLIRFDLRSGSMDNLLSSCLLLEDLHIQLLWWHLPRVRLGPNLQHLKRVHVECAIILQIEAPNLTDLSLVSVLLTDKFFEDFGVKFPRLLRLKLSVRGKYLKRVCISSPSLQFLQLSDVAISERLELDLPCLLLFAYRTVGVIVPSLFMTSISGKLESRIFIFCGRSNLAHSKFLCSTREFLKGLVGSRIVLEIQSDNTTSMEVGDLQLHHPLLKIDKLNLISCSAPLVNCLSNFYSPNTIERTS